MKHTAKCSSSNIGDSCAPSVNYTICSIQVNSNNRTRKELKGELNLDKTWQSDDLFYIIMNKIHPRFNQF